MVDLVTDVMKDLPDSEKAKIKLDADSVESVKIHRFDVPKDPNLDKFVAEVAGDNKLYVAFRDDAVFIAMGKEALPTLKAAVAQNSAVASPPLVFDFDAARMAPLMAQTKQQKDLAAKLFGNGESGRVRLSIDGGDTLSARLQMRLSVLEFLVKMKAEME